MPSSAARSTADLAPQSDTPTDCTKNAKSERRRPYKTLDRGYCRFAPEVRHRIQALALMEAGPDAPATLVSKRIQELQRLLSDLSRVCVREGTAGVISRAKLSKHLCLNKWPGLLSAKMTQYKLDDGLRRLKKDAGLITEAQRGVIIIEFWNAYSHAYCPSQEELDAHRRHKLELDAASRRRRYAEKHPKKTDALDEQTLSEDHAQVIDNIDFFESVAQPTHTSMPTPTAGRGDSVDKYSANLNKHAWSAFPAKSPRVRGTAAVGFDPCSAAGKAELDALDAELAAATVAMEAERAPSQEHVGSSNPDFAQAIGELDPEMAALVTGARASFATRWSQSETPSAGCPPTESPPVPTESPSEPNSRVPQSPVVGNGWPEGACPPDLRPKRVTLAQARLARAEHGRDWAHLPIGAIMAIMAERGADGWGVNWFKCRRWAMNEALLVDAIDATRHCIAGGGIKNQAGHFVGVLRNKARIWMSEQTRDESVKNTG